jgi:hypothetical protein
MRINKLFKYVQKTCGAAVLGAALIVGASFIAACANPAGDDDLKKSLLETGFVAVTDITGIPEAVQPEAAVDLSALAVVAPSNATKKTITWSVGSESGAVVNNQTLTAPAAEGEFTLTATITGGGADGANFTKDFTIDVSVDAAEIAPFVAVTDITGIPEAVQPEAELDLFALADITPDNASKTTITWSVSAESGAAVTGQTLTAPAADGDFVLNAKIAGGGSGGEDFTKNFTIAVSTEAAEVVVPFKAVTGITGIPSTVAAEGQIDLSAAVVTPVNATNTAIVWSADGGATVAGQTVTAPGAAGTFTLTATIANGTAEGTAYTKEFVVTVTVTEPDGPGTGGELVLTANVSFGNVLLDDTVLVLPDMEAEEEAEQAVEITVSGTDTRAVKAAHFIVYMGAGQTIAVSGADAASVAVATEGNVAGISDTASAEAAIVSVDLDNFDAQFEGKDYDFTLTVSETGKTSKIYPVTLSATPELTGAAVFVVDRSQPYTRCGECGDCSAWARGFSGAGDACVKGGKITRITAANFAGYITASLGGAENATANAIALANVDTLSDAIVWVDHNAKADTEYLIRVENDEDLVRHCLTCMGQENVIVRLRGYERERVLQYDRVNGQEPSIVKHNVNVSTTKFSGGWFNIGSAQDGYKHNRIALQIERNITLDGEGTPLVEGSNNYLKAMIFIYGNGSRFIMEEGSKITRFKPGNSQYQYAIIYLSTSNAGCMFEMKGGVISNFIAVGTGSTANFGFISKAGTNATFKKTGGSFNNNTHTYLCVNGSTAAGFGGELDSSTDYNITGYFSN